jgi:hypothetical protein
MARHVNKKEEDDSYMKNVIAELRHFGHLPAEGEDEKNEKK